MNKLFLTMTLAFSTMIASAQYSVLTTITSVEEENETTYNITDELGVGYQVGEKLMVGLTRNGDDNFNLLGRYALMNGVWGTCIYNYSAENFQETELMDNVKLGLGYSFKVWNNLYVDPSYTMPAKENEAGEREGTFNLGVSYKL